MVRSRTKSSCTWDVSWNSSTNTWRQRRCRYSRTSGWCNNSSLVSNIKSSKSTEFCEYFARWYGCRISIAILRTFLPIFGKTSSSSSPLVTPFVASFVLSMEIAFKTVTGRIWFPPPEDNVVGDFSSMFCFWQMSFNKRSWSVWSIMLNDPSNVWIKMLLVSDPTTVFIPSWVINAPNAFVKPKVLRTLGRFPNSLPNLRSILEHTEWKVPMVVRRMSSREIAEVSLLSLGSAFPCSTTPPSPATISDSELVDNKFDSNCPCCVIADDTKAVNLRSISMADFFVNVTANIPSFSFAWCVLSSNKCAIRHVSTFVFPAPGPAITRVMEYRGRNVASLWAVLSCSVIMPEMPATDLAATSFSSNEFNPKEENEARRGKKDDFLGQCHPSFFMCVFGFLRRIILLVPASLQQLLGVNKIGDTGAKYATFCRIKRL